MNVKKFVAKAIVVGGVGLPAVGLGMGVANADPPSKPPGPKPHVPSASSVMANGNRVGPTTVATRFTSRGTPVSARMAQGTKPQGENADLGAPTTTAEPFGSAEGRSASAMTGLNPHGRDESDTGSFGRARMLGRFGGLPRLGNQMTASAP